LFCLAKMARMRTAFFTVLFLPILGDGLVLFSWTLNYKKRWWLLPPSS
jgi:hypothetical protein